MRATQTGLPSIYTVGKGGDRIRDFSTHILLHLELRFSNYGARWGQSTLQNIVACKTRYYVTIANRFPRYLINTKQQRNFCKQCFLWSAATTEKTCFLRGPCRGSILKTIGVTEFCTAVYEKRTWACEAEKSPLLEAVTRKRLVKTLKTGEGLAYSDL
jgi:hypothetical protein